MNHLITLTDWESGDTVMVDPSRITVCRRLRSETISDSFVGGNPVELGARTKIVVGQDLILVRETPEEIAALAGRRGQ